MVSAITNGVKVSVRAEYQPSYSDDKNQHHVFTYHIFIENNSEYTVQLLKRKWDISDSNGFQKVVAGEGVVGQQPTIEPGEGYQYVSGCNLRTNMGQMKGFYVMERMLDGHQFEVEIPAFNLIAPFKFN
ncbi:Co2+/Mg2+ efflux protein ApaG [Sediminitomix flava]|nr:Co2+/Mg2+ efflux protein ApaG [Sediminitomix flava]